MRILGVQTQVKPLWHFKFLKFEKQKPLKVI